MTKEEQFIDYEIPSEDRPKYLDIDGKRIYVSEEVYRAYKQPLWTEHKRQERERRCRVSNGRGGLKRCTEDCATCPFPKNGSILSVDHFYEEYELEIADKSEGILESIVEEEFNSKLWEAVDGLDEVDQQIARLFSQGLSERAIAEKVNLSQKAINKRKNRIFSELKDKLKKSI
jgi:RNA polymerase sigma factor (sigma-70 family)